jgi:molecular chaperone HtpG
LGQISTNFATHSPKTVSAQAPTCTENGYTAGEICEICDAILGSREEIPATGHNYDGDTCTICGNVNVLAILDGKYVSLQEYLDAAKDKHENQVFFVSDEQQQSHYIRMFREEGLNAVVLPHLIDQSFMQRIEMEHEGVKFQRIHSDLADIFKEETSEEDKKALEEAQEKLTDLFKKALGVEELDVKVEKLKDAETSAVVTLSEDVRRMQDMMRMYGMNSSQMPGGEGQTLVLNTGNALVQYVLANPEGEHTELFCQQIYDLALLAHMPLGAEEMTKFVERSNQIMELLAK